MSDAAEEFAVVVRSGIHDRTWVAHIAYAEFANTPAGPLRLVKAECVLQAEESGIVSYRWRNPSSDTWVLEAHAWANVP